MRSDSILSCIVMVAACALFAGCGGSPEDPASISMTRLQSDIAKNLPKGWNLGIAKDSGIDFGTYAKPTDLLIWKTEKAILRRPGSAVDEEAKVRAPVQLFFALKFSPFVKPEEYPGIYKANSLIKKQHDYWNKTVSHIPRGADGRPAPRGDEEKLQVAEYNKEYPKLPPYNSELPTHYYGVMGLRVWDSRPILEPEDRMLQQEMNATYFAITKPLISYKKQ